MNATDSQQSLSIQLASVSNVDKSAKVTTLTASTTQSTNSILEPKKIIPVESSIDDAALQFSHTLPRNSIQVLELNAKLSGPNFTNDFAVLRIIALASCAALDG